MAEKRTKRSDQVQLIKEAVLQLAKQRGETIVEANIPVTEVKLPSLYFWLTPLGPRTNLEVWDENHGGKTRCSI